MKNLFKSLLFVLAANFVYAQSGQIQGKIIDKATGEGIPFANIVAEQNGVQKGGASTDFDGNYSIKPLNPGKYDVKISYVGYQPSETKGVIVSGDQIAFLNIGMNSGIKLDEVEVVDYKVPLIQKDETATGSTVTKEQIANLPIRSVQSIASTTAGVIQRDESKTDLNIKGSRNDATSYIIDGIKVRGSAAVPSSSIEQMTVLTGGIPAKYGDVTGGVISITTRGPSKNFNGSVEAVTSKFLDPYGYNLLNGTLTGPILLKDKGTQMERPLLGFFISGEYEYNKDTRPRQLGVYKVKDDKLQELINNPISKAEGTGAMQRNVEFITKDDLEHVKARPNAQGNAYRANGKIDYAINKYMNLNLGGSWAYDKHHTDVYDYTLFDYEALGWDIDNDYRAFIKFTHKVSKQKTKEEAQKKSSAINNFYYSVQFDYSKEKFKREDAVFGDKLFDYGYIGKFQTEQINTYKTSPDTMPGHPEFTGYIMDGIADNGVTFTAGSQNPYLAKITSAYYDIFDNSPNSVDIIEQGGGMVNGKRTSFATQTAYSLWSMPGRRVNSYIVDNNDQYRISLDGSFDINKKGAKESNKHSIEFGVELEKRIDRSFSIGPITLWSLMKQNTNNHIDQLDTIPIYNLGDDGVLGDWDTVTFNRMLVTTDQTFFDKSLRAKLGKSQTEWLDIDAMDPETFSLELFEPDELFNNGSSLVSYQGYDYLGNKLKKQPKFEDFWTEKANKNGTNYFTRPQRANVPVYSAIYAQDKFAFKDLILNIGLRVDRFDAKSMTLKDKYSLYPIKTTGEVPGSLNKENNGSHPSNIGSDYAVYVNDPINPSEILGYRNEDDWYDANGTALSSATSIAQQGGGEVKPYLVNKNKKDDIKSESFDPSQSFEKYKAQPTFMPRVAFSFPISDLALFFAHYDVLTQRPTGDRNIVNPYDYYYFNENTFINNANLKPQKSIEYQLGFKQKVSKTSALTLSGFYKEIKDMIQQRPINHAYPTNYTTFDNIDFGTVKGFSFAYDLRRTKNVTLMANYTLQFADGTGSGDRSQSTLLASGGQENIRIILPLNYDQRHVITASIDYRFSEGKDYDGPRWFKKDIFANAGVNIIARAGSGFPYSKLSSAARTPDKDLRFISIIGEPNSSRLPWSFKMDFKIEKNFKIKYGKKQGDKRTKQLNLNVYYTILNVLNSKTILNVHRFTGSPIDDGYLSSLQGQQEVANKTPDKDSFVDLYSIYILDTNVDDSDANYGLPRFMRAGIIVEF